MQIAEDPPPGVRMRIVTPPDEDGASLEMGVGQSGGAWFGYAGVRPGSDDDLVVVSVDSLTHMAHALRQRSDSDRASVVAESAGVEGGSVVVRAAPHDTVSVTVTTPSGVTRHASYLRAGVGHMADALVQRTTEEQ